MCSPRCCKQPAKTEEPAETEEPTKAKKADKGMEIEKVIEAHKKENHFIDKLMCYCPGGEDTLDAFIVAMEYCKVMLDLTDDKLRELGLESSDQECQIAAHQEGVTIKTAGIDVLEDGIRALDKSVVEATE